MQVLRISFLFLFISFISQINLQAQVEDESLTESSEVEDTSGYLDDIVEREVLNEQRILAYEPIREADIVWEKRIWRVIDVREKMNIQFLYPEKPFFKILIDAAKSGDVKIFSTDEFKKRVTGADLEAQLSNTDTTTVYDPDTYEETVKIIHNDIDFNDIKKFRVKELWYFDKESSRMNCRILGIAPVKEEKDASTGEVKYELPMFWMYYPELRHVLARERVFNEKNDISPSSWADIFDTRFFSSYIIKQSNVQSMRLEDIFTGEKWGDNAGIQMLLESEKIKSELFNFEHDLWVY
ncbi:MAG: gliding motility protein GldN [Saprospiraceae bacterium]|jgi:gliding motility associated protien GldN|nr:gliding motility protein GldN [Saprospiraceae bacterium]